ncbi:MAG: GNAT family N-acetyltransferase [Halobacteria archaeon]|nr:GNAT family N-acetyltransferase [Halobacteria archaeon]
MNYRDAMEDDAARIVEIANEYVLDENLSVESMNDLIQDRTVKVAEEEGDDANEIRGYISYQATRGKVMVQHLGVVPDYRDEVTAQLLENATRYADDHDMATRIAVEENSWCIPILERHGFEHVGNESFKDEELVVYER